VAVHFDCRRGWIGILGCLGIVLTASCAQVSGLDSLARVRCVDSCDGGDNAPDSAQEATGALDTGIVDVGIVDTGTVEGDDGGSVEDSADTLDGPDEGDESVEASSALEAGQDASVLDASDAAGNVDATAGAEAGGDAAVTDATESGPDDASRDATADAVAPSDAAPEAMGCISIASGLLAHWTMDANSISGTRLADSSGNGNNGTLTGFPTPATAPGRFGDALSYPAASNAYVLVPTIALNQTAGGANSVSLWFYRSGTVSDVLINLPDSPRYDLWLTGGTGDFLCINTARNDCFGVQDSTLLGRWVHVVAIFFNGPTTKGSLYIDGQNRNPTCLSGTNGFGGCSSSATAAPPVSLGGQTSFYFHGLLDEVRIYNRALTAAEVSDLYNATACP